MDDHRRADDENGETDDARAQMGRERHRELGTGKEGERGVAVVHERDDEEPEGVVDEGERERGESEGAEGSVTHGRGDRMGHSRGAARARIEFDLIKSNYADGAWTRWRQRWMYSQEELGLVGVRSVRSRK